MGIQGSLDLCLSGALTRETWAQSWRVLEKAKLGFHLWPLSLWNSSPNSLLAVF